MCCMQGGRVEFKGGTYGQLTGEGPSGGLAPVHHVTIDDRRNGQVVEVDIPEDRCCSQFCWPRFSSSLFYSLLEAGAPTAHYDSHYRL